MRKEESTKKEKEKVRESKYDRETDVKKKNFNVHRESY